MKWISQQNFSYLFTIVDAMKDMSLEAFRKKKHQNKTDLQL